MRHTSCKMIDFKNFSKIDWEAYFSEHPTYRHIAGYGNYDNEFREKNLIRTEVFLKNIKGDVLELGGARGERAIHCLGSEMISSWEIIDLYDSPRKLTHPKLRYTFGDALWNLERHKPVDCIFTCRFLECLDPKELGPVIREMNRCAKRQWHIVTLYKETKYYNAQIMGWWKGRDFAEGTRIISYQDFLKL